MEREELFEELEEVHGIRKKSMAAALNKEVISKYEMDEIFIV